MYDHGGMNRAYRLIWNRAKGLWVVAPETAKGGGYAVGTVVPVGLIALGLVAASGSALADPAANALPAGGRVVAGSVSISENGASMTVTQGSARGIVNWNSFDVGSSATVTFKQPDAASVTLNRVTGGAGSVIAGKMNANGKVYVVNPNGVLFSKTARVDVGGLVASTADITNQDFMAGKEVFTSNGATGSVINQGSINAHDGGSVVLIGGTVSNQGTINARSGDVALAAGAKVTLDAGANGHLKIEVDGATTAALVENGGLISASGGRVLMTAQGASAAVSSVVSNTGTVEAQTIAHGAGGKAGRIDLLAGMQGGEVKVGGRIDASAPNGGDGGHVETSAATVTIAPGAKVTTLADKGKTGNWLIDPYNVTISAAADSGSGFTATANDTVINVTTLTNALASTGVTVTTGTGGSQAGDITVAAPIHWSANTTLTLNAAGDIYIDKDITATGNSAGLVLNYGSGKDYHLRNGARVTLPGSNSAFSAGGSAFTLIRSLNDLNSVRNATASNHAIVADIDASATTGWNGGAGFTPISGMSGQFHGLGHVIDGLFVNRPGSVNVALLGNTTNIVRDVTLSNVNITGGSRVGAVLGTASGTTVSNVHVTGSVKGTIEQTGGIVGVTDSSTLLGSSSAATVTGVTQTGGLVGRARYSTISDSYATGSVTGTGTFTGGLVGGTDMGGTLARVYASGKVTGTTDVGGLIGGPVAGGLATTTNAYWDSGTTGQPSSYGNEVTSVNARQQATYTGFDFTNSWVMYESSTRPMLRNEHSTVIATPAALQLMALDPKASYTLGADIDFGSAFTADSGRYAGLWGAGGFVPVGTSASKFTGSFDGQNHKITGLTIDRPSTSYVGLFGYADAGAAISNVTLSGGTVTGQSNVGALVGYLRQGTVTNAASGATVIGAGTGAGEVGGLIGVNDAGTVTSSSASGSVTGSGYDVGGLVGYLVNGGVITKSFATGSVTGNSSGQGYVGGLVGTNGYNAGTGGTISQSYATGTVSSTAGPIGGLVGFNQGAITDSYASGRVIGTGGANTIGGFIGVNGPTGTIANAYATGYVTGPSQIGGFGGYNNNSPSAITNAYWNSQTSGLGTGISGGGGGITARTTAQLQGTLPTGFSSTIWGTGAGLYPYFGWSYATTPVAVSGKAYSNAGTTALAGATVAAVTNGTAFGSAVSGADGSYYIVGAAGSINAAGVLTYLDNHATKGAAFADTVTAAGVTGLDIYGSAVHLVAGKSSLSATRTGYVTTRGSFSDTDLSFLSSNSFAPLTTTAGYGVHLSAASGYSLDGSLGSGGLLTLNSGGTFGVSGTVGLTAAGALTVNAPLSWSDAASLTLTTSDNGNVTLGGAVSAPLGSLTVATGGTGTATAGAAVNVRNFSLTSGSWSQIAGTLPAFAATDFRLTSGATFLRATGGDGSAGTPYQIADVYGLQGMGSTSLAAKSFRLAGVIDASGTTTWNAGAGFSPIGTSATPFTGTLDGQGYSISNLTIARPSGSEQGLFGVIGASATVSNVRLSSANVSGLNDVGALAGVNHGTITGSYSDGTVTGAGTDVGNLVGENDGSIANSFATGSTTGTGTNVGGLVGHHLGSGSITNAYATGTVTGGASSNNLGGLVGLNADMATISNSYATGSVTSAATGARLGGLIGERLGGATSNSFWNTTTSGLAAGVGTGSATGVTGLDSAGMMTLSNFTGAGWGIEDKGGTSTVWRIYDGFTAPLLRSFMTSLTVTGGTATKTYDGSDVSTAVGTLTYNPTSYTASNVLGTARYKASSANAGTYSGTDLTFSGLYSTQFGYDILMTPGTLAIARAALTVTADTAGKTYDGLAYTGGAGVSYSGFVNGETAGVLGGTLAYGGTAQGAVNAGSYTLTASGLTSSNYDITYAPGTLTVNKAALTVTADNAGKTYDGLAYNGGAGVSYSGFVNGETSAVLGGTLAYGGTAQGAVNAGSYTLTASGLTSGNYDITYAPGTLAIARAALTVTADNAGKTYDGLAYSGGAGVSYSGFVNGETAGVLGGTLAYGGTAQGAVNAGTYTLTASGLTSSNYDIAYAPGTLAIAKAALTVTADSQKVGRRDKAGPLTYTVGGAGFGHGDTAETVFSGALSSTDDLTASGGYSITQGTLALVSNNYILAEFIPGVLEVTAAANTDRPTASTLNRVTTPFTDQESNGELSAAPSNGASNMEYRTAVEPTANLNSSNFPFLTFAPVLIKLDNQ